MDLCLIVPIALRIRYFRERSGTPDKLSLSPDSKPKAQCTRNYSQEVKAFLISSIKGLHLGFCVCLFFVCLLLLAPCLKPFNYQAMTMCSAWIHTPWEKPGNVRRSSNSEGFCEIRVVHY